MRYIKYLFNYYNKEYLIKSYLVALFMAFLYISGTLEGDKVDVLISVEGMKYIVIAISFTILYPFSKGTYLSIKESLLSEIPIIFANIIVIFIGKLFMAMILWGFSVPLWIVNLIIIYTKYRKNTVKIIKKDITGDIEGFKID